MTIEFGNVFQLKLHGNGKGGECDI